jgi:hypothetical protein
MQASHLDPRHFVSSASRIPLVLLERGEPHERIRAVAGINYDEISYFFTLPGFFST